MIKLYTYQVDEFEYDYSAGIEHTIDNVKMVETKDYAMKIWKDFLNSEKKENIFCTEIFTDHNRAFKAAKNECNRWFFLLEYKVSLKQLEYLLQDDHEEKSLILHKVYPLVYLPE